MSDPFNLATIGHGLPVAERTDALADAARTGAMVVTAPPGTGKTTLVPPLVSSLVDGMTTVVQPRRVAVRAAARRLAELDGSPIGERIGFTVRGERKLRPGARIEVVTPGVLLRRLLADPELAGTGAVILDEIHERSLEIDLLLGMLADVRALREDLQVTAMSATLDASAVAAVLGSDGSPAPVVDVPAALHPLAIEYAPPPVPRLDHRGVTFAYLDHLAATTVRAHDAASDVDALVFVPGAREVDETVRRLRALTDADVLPLHGRLGPCEQDRATSGRGPGDGRRIVVSTALAESSLTVPGVRLVVDACLSREIRRDRGRGMTGLVTVTESKASADQRAGRAAREAPGTAVRVIDETDAARMRAASPPEIASADLTDAALLLASWGTPRGDDLPLLDAPPEAAIREAEDTLRALRLVDADGRATPRGREVAAMPVGVREATALLEIPGSAPVVAALADDHRAEGADLDRLLASLRSGRAPGADRWRRETRRLEGLARASADGRPSTGTVVATARPDRIARRTGARARSYLLASGTRAALPEGSSLMGQEWLAVWEVQRAEGRAADGTGAVIRLAAPLAEEDALRIGAPMMAEERRARVDGTKVVARMERRLGAIPLSSTPVAAGPDDHALAIEQHVREAGLAGLTWSNSADSLRRRLALIHRELGAPWPAMDDASLLDQADEWLVPAIAQLRPGQGLGRLDLASALRSLLPWPEAVRLDELAPERLAVPSGSHVRIEYPPVDAEDPQPVVSVKLQETFGLAESPRLVDGRVPVLFHLLSPARRPLAVTADLASFWEGPYREVRKEMRGRYPKHPWPEDPWSAPATARTTKRSFRRPDR